MVAAMSLIEVSISVGIQSRKSNVARLSYAALLPSNGIIPFN